jgi:membrane protease YdiL (CAAX protease family)
MNGGTPKWTRIAFYCLIAFSGSALHRFAFLASTEATSEWSIYRNWIGGLGPALGAIGVFVLFRYRTRITLFGNGKPYALAMVSTPAVVMASIGLPNRFGVNAHLFGGSLGVMVVIYAILEELGWRGYLQDELSDFSKLPKYMLIGLIWYAWHFSWVEDHAIRDQVFNIGFMIAASVGIGFVADRTASVLAAAAFHVIGDIMGLMPDFRAMIPDSYQRFVIVATCVAVWLITMRIWRIRAGAPVHKSDQNVSVLD